ncbi:MAG: alpha/beta hydrolase, partial [Pirellulales bacterium]|nr:alpha/beta hydrolase [Pirellulales bacterium]
MSRAVSLISLLLLLMSLQQSSKASGFPEGMVAPDWQSSASAHFDQAPETTQQLRERLRNLTAKRNIRVERNVVYVTRGEDDLLMDVYMPEAAGSHAAVLVVHGGAWRSGSKAQLMGYARELASRGHVAFAINYRLAPDHIFPAQIEDCRAAIRFIHKNAEKYNVDRQRLGAIGYSAGGHLVALLGVQGVSVEVETTQPPDDAHRGQNGATTNAQLTNGQTKTDGGSSTIRLKAVVPGGAPCDFRAMPANSRGLAFWLGGTSREK